MESRNKEGPSDMLSFPHLHLPTLNVFTESDFRLDEVENFVGGGAGVELDGVELSVHEVEAGVDGAPVDGAHDLSLGGGPLPPPGPQGLVETLQTTQLGHYILKCIRLAFWYQRLKLIKSVSIQVFRHTIKLCSKDVHPWGGRWWF